MRLLVGGSVPARGGLVGGEGVWPAAEGARLEVGEERGGVNGRRLEVGEERGCKWEKMRIIRMFATVTLHDMPHQLHTLTFQMLTFHV